MGSMGSMREDRATPILSSPLLSSMATLTITRTTTDSHQSTVDLSSLTEGIPNTLPELPAWNSQVPHAPSRTPKLTDQEFELAVRNALRYFPAHQHATLAPEFADELRRFGHIYMHRFRPTAYPMRAFPIHLYPARCRQAAAIMMMIQNNLDPAVAQYPHELVTYGGNGSVFQNWAQYRLVMRFLATMTEDQTLVIYSGHPLGLFPSTPQAPRVVITNGMIIPHYSSREEYETFQALGVTMYGQMTAGSYCYIGPQGIVHGTTITLLNAGRKYLGSPNMRGKVFVTSGLGGMSGAQPKAGVICGSIIVVAEVDKAAIDKRLSQGWVQEVSNSLDECLARIRTARATREVLSLAFHGNVVSLWERLAEAEDMLVDLGSDQTSLHNPFNGGYIPVQVPLEEANRIMKEDPAHFKELVQESLCRHVAAINKLCARGMKFWDYGNAFLLEAGRAGADVLGADGKGFRYPSYVQDIMGDIFSLGFGPFRWVCASNNPSDLEKTDEMAREVIAKVARVSPERTQQQYEDNIRWITHAGAHKLVVGSQARILYSDAEGRMAMAHAFNTAVADGTLKGPVILSRDHHDVSGTDSPFRETSNITDGSNFCADMAVQNFAGDSFRGATWVALHNGGGVGWGEVINGGFGLVLDGTEDAARRAREMLLWDVTNGVARRAWGRNENAEYAMKRAMEANPLLQVTMPVHVDDAVFEQMKKAEKPE